MAIVKPFQAIRPQKEYASQIAALPYDVYDRQEAAAVVKENPLSFLSIDRAETAFSPEINMYDDRVYQKAGELLRKRIQDGFLIQDPQKGFYLYELTYHQRVQNGIVALCSVDDYLHHVILKHEKTREEKEQDRIRHIQACHAQTGPVFLAYPDRPDLQEMIRTIKERKPEFDFIAEDGIRHRGFAVFENEKIAELEKAFQKVEKLYIADGHHRCASAVKLCQKYRSAGYGNARDAEYNYVLSVLFPQSELTILGYHRLIRDLNGLTEEGFLKQLQISFEIQRMQEAGLPQQKGCFGMYLSGQWYLLKWKPEENTDDSMIDRMDASILQKYCLQPILGISDPRTDKRIDFCSGIRGLQELEHRVHTDCQAAFVLKAVSIEEWIQAAESGLLMPPKSTWFEPKLRSGLFIHKIEGEKVT